MARRGSRSDKDFSANLLWRCLVFWAAPIAFLFLAATSLHDPQSNVVANSAPVLALLFGTSLVSLLLDCWLHCRGGLILLQLVVQGAVVLMQSDLAPSVFGHAAAAKFPAQASPSQATPAAPQPPPQPQPQQPAPAGRPPPRRPAPAASAGQQERPRPLLARGRNPTPPRPGFEAEKMSIVLPCLNETRFVVKTVTRFCERTPQDLLEEIIVVDDGSSPPLEGELAKAGIPDHCRLRVLRHDKPWGLMIAKQTGGDAAVGKYIGFYDCHVAPVEGWHRETVELLRAKSRRLVVPMIGDLDLDTWDLKNNGALTAKCYINFNADFWWYDDESDNIPVISGGLVATTREWWQLSGGFDSGMRGWGGENTDQSLRAWLCEGDVLRAKSSIIAHMWRVPNDGRTLAKYRFPTRTDNLARVAAIWFDEFRVKFRNGDIDSSINVSEALDVRQRLHCKPFVHFLHRFRRIYRDGGLLPEKVFRIREVGTNKCMQRNGGAFVMRECDKGTMFHLANMLPLGFPASGRSLTQDHSNDGGSGDSESGEVTCGNHKAKNCAGCPQGHGQGWCHNDCVWNFGMCVLRSRYEEEMKRQRSAQRKPCCSGIREWNSLECFDKLEAHGPTGYNCDVTGKNENQQYLWDEDGHIRHQTGRCISSTSDRKLKAGPCEGATRWEQIDDKIPEETKIYDKLVKEHGLTEDMPDH